MKRMLFIGAVALLTGACGREVALVSPTAVVAPTDDTAPAVETTAVPPAAATTAVPVTTAVPATISTTVAPATTVAAPRTTVTRARTPTTASAPTTGCHPSYTGACLPAGASDVDCQGGSGNGPVYTGRVQVVGPDVFDLDRDADGVGCE